MGQQMAANGDDSDSLNTTLEGVAAKWRPPGKRPQATPSSGKARAIAPAPSSEESAVAGVPGARVSFLINGNVARLSLPPSASSQEALGAVSRAVTASGGFQVKLSAHPSGVRMHVLDSQNANVTAGELWEQKEQILDAVKRETGIAPRDLQLSVAAYNHLIAECTVDEHEASSEALASVQNALTEALSTRVKGTVAAALMPPAKARRYTVTGAVKLDPIDLCWDRGQDIVQGVPALERALRSAPALIHEHNSSLLRKAAEVLRGRGQDASTVFAGTQERAGDAQKQSLTSWSVTEDGCLEGRIRFTACVESLTGSPQEHLELVAATCLSASLNDYRDAIEDNDALDTSYSTRMDDAMCFA